MPLINCGECGSQISDLAGACPSCGFPQKRQVAQIDSVAETVARSESFNTNPLLHICPKCNSANVQKFSVLNACGTTTSVSSGVGLSSGNLAVGVGTTTSETMLAKITAHPPKYEHEPVIAAVLSLIFVFLAGFIQLGLIVEIARSGTDWFGIAVLFGLPAFFLFRAFYKKQFSVIRKVFGGENTVGTNAYKKKIYMLELEEWERKFYCLTCGNEFIGI